MQLKQEYINQDIEQVRKDEIKDRRIKTWAGEYIDPVRPNERNIRIDDIAHSLSLVCRYGGHIPQFYSVADHSINVLNRVEGLGVTNPRIRLMALLHDAEEAYFGDMPSPLKDNYMDYRTHGNMMRHIIYDKYIPFWYATDPNDRSVIDKADAEVYLMERSSFFTPFEEASEFMAKRFNMEPLRARSFTQAENTFILRYEMLTNELSK